jgi:hypothetical protein
MPIRVREAKGGKLKVTGTGNTPEERKELDRLAQLELRKLGTDKRDEWFEEKYKGEKVAGPDAFKSAMGLKWDYSLPAPPAMKDMGFEKVKLYAPKDLEDLERRRPTSMLNWGGMTEKGRQAFQEASDEDLATFGEGLLEDRNRRTKSEAIRNEKGELTGGIEGWQIEREPLFDIRGWRFDASQHYGGQTTENLPWAEEAWVNDSEKRVPSWSKYVTPYILDDGKTFGLMWINPRIPKGLTAEKVISNFLSDNQTQLEVIGESTRLAKEADTKSGAAYREDYAKARKAEGKGGTVPSASEGPLSPEMKAKRTFRLRSAVEEERRLMEEPLKKDKK